MFELEAIQSAIKEFGFDGWLLYDFRGNNLLARRILDLEQKPVGSRRFFYLIPASGSPHKLVHRIESQSLDHLPGEKQVYLTWQELETKLKQLLNGHSQVAMEYSPKAANPYVSRVDAGTVELVQSFDVRVQSSGDLVQYFEARWSPEQWQLHLQASEYNEAAFQKAWQFIAERVRSDGQTDEQSVREVIMQHYREHNMTTYHPPIVAVGPHGGDPHYETGTGKDCTIQHHSYVLIDAWAKRDQPAAVYSDLTQVGCVAETVPAEYQRIFEIVAAGRDAAINLVRTAFATGVTIQGWQVDQAARDVITAAGYPEAFVHRTGHSIGQETHGNGANMDNLETHETRQVMRRTCFSIEPGIYLDEFGIRSEVDVYIDEGGTVHVTGGEPQRAPLAVLAVY